MHDVQSIISQSPPVDVTKPYDADNLKGKVIVITGGANGLGAHMVRKWASHGAHIFIGDIDDAAGEALVAQLRAEHEGQTFHYLRCNVVEWEDQVGLFDAAVRLSPTGAMDIVVPNAGGRAVWECYTYDYDQVESFRWRYIQILNAIEASRGYLAWLKDIIGIYWRK
uniref:Uncharacterized protein n=1 Tax=Bionectria ochroleuca TaxID=29856 RepID=A0A0B7K0D6_BIOOC